MLGIFPSHLMLLKIYAYFLADVMNNEDEAMEIHTKALAIMQNQTNIQNQLHKV